MQIKMRKHKRQIRFLEGWIYLENYGAEHDFTKRLPRIPDIWMDSSERQEDML